MLRFFNVHYQYPSGSGVFDLSFSVENGEFVFLVGPSGAGKTTIFRLINFELFPQQGHILLNNINSNTVSEKDVPFIRRQLGVVFQDFKLLEDRSVFDNVAFAMYAVGAPRRKIRRRVLEMLKEVGLSHKRKIFPQQLSGGEQQRVAIARALVNEPFILLADEPTANLDKETAGEIFRLLERINSRGTAVLMATHNERLATQSGKRIIYLKNGRIIA